MTFKAGVSLPREMPKSTLLDDGGERHRYTSSGIHFFIGDMVIPPDPEDVSQARAVVGIKAA